MARLKPMKRLYTRGAAISGLPIGFAMARLKQHRTEFPKRHDRIKGLPIGFAMARLKLAVANECLYTG